MKSLNQERREAALADMYDYIAGYIVRNSRPPTKREICAALQISSTSIVQYRLMKLERRGLIKLTPYISRGIALAQQHAQQQA